MNYAQIFARKKEYEKKLLAVNPRLNNRSGIYIFYRYENGFNYAYVGQALHLIDRLVAHLEGYKQHIDKSLKKHKLYSKENNKGWNLSFINCHPSNLDQIEKQMILDYATAGYQMLNKTGGGQGDGKFSISENKERKGYLQGKNEGKIQTLRKIKIYFNKYLDVTIKGELNKIKQRKLKEFMELLNGAEDKEADRNDKSSD